MERGQQHLLRNCEEHLEGDISEPALKAADRRKNVESYLSLCVTEVHGAGKCRALQASSSRGSERIILLQLHLSYTQKGSLAQGLLPPDFSPFTDFTPQHRSFDTSCLFQPQPDAGLTHRRGCSQPFLGSGALPGCRLSASQGEFQ